MTGAISGVIWVAIIHVLRRYARRILFVLLLGAALAYPIFAIRRGAGPMWVLRSTSVVSDSVSELRSARTSLRRASRLARDEAGHRGVPLYAAALLS
jgi:dolichol kinase